MANKPVAYEDAHFFQKHLIPAASKEVRLAMQKAALHGHSDNFFVAHFVSVAYAVKAVALSFFNTLHYLQVSITRFLVNVVNLDMAQAFKELAGNLRDAALSLTLVTCGVFYIAAIALAPKQVGSFFAPVDLESQVVKLKQAIDQAELEKQRLEEKILELEEENASQEENLQALNAQLEASGRLLLTNQQQIRENHEQVAYLRENLERAVESREIGLKLIEQVKQQKALYEIMVKEQEKTIAELTAQRNEVYSSNRTLLAQIEQLAPLQQQLSEQIEQNKQLTAQLNAQQERFTAENKEMEKRLESALSSGENIEQLQREKQQLSLQIAEFEELRKSHSVLTEQLKSKEDEFGKQIAAIQKECAEKIEASGREVEKVRQEKAQLLEQKQQLEQQLQRLQMLEKQQQSLIDAKTNAEQRASKAEEHLQQQQQKIRDLEAILANSASETGSNPLARSVLKEDFIVIEREIDLTASLTLDGKAEEKFKMTDAFRGYVESFCPGYTPEQALKLVEIGDAIKTKIENDQIDDIPKEQRRLLVAPLIWRMMHHVIEEEGKGFQQGNLVCLDPGYRILNFLLSIGSPHVHPRMSSHFKNKILPTDFNGKHRTTSYGLDIAQDEKSGLPSNKRTINFAPIQTLQSGNWIFIKPEDHGVATLSDGFWHVVSYLETRLKHWAPDLAGPINGDHDKKEHLPPETANEFKKVLESLYGSRDLPALVQNFGIAGMVHYLLNYLENNVIDTNQLAIIDQFLTHLSKYKDPSLRNGNEALIGQNFFASSNKENLTAFEELLQLVNLKKLLDAPDKDAKAITEALGQLQRKPSNAVECQEMLDLSDKAELDKSKIFFQINRDLKNGSRIQNQTVTLFQIDGKQFDFNHSAKEIFEDLMQKNCFNKNENAVLEVMWLMEQWSRGYIAQKLGCVFVTQKLDDMPDTQIEMQSKPADPKGFSSQIKILTEPHLKVEIQQNCILSTTSHRGKQSFAILAGKVEIDYSSGLPQAKRSWKIEEILNSKSE